MKIETKCVQAGYQPKHGEPRVMPIVQSTTYKYDSGEFVGELFDLKVEGHLYSRISNPTVGYVEEKIAALENGVGAMLVSSGQSAMLATVLTICKAGDNIVVSKDIYGGTTNLFDSMLSNFGLEFTFVDFSLDEDQIIKNIKPNTKLIIGESLSNPTLKVMDIEKIGKIAKTFNLPFAVDNTFATPINCSPFEHGANIIIHSTSKYMDGHACVIGGAVVDGGNYDWTNGKFPDFTEPNESYHGLVFAEAFGNQAFIAKARTQILRDAGCIMSPHSAFLLNLGLETLALRVERHSENGLKVAKYLENHEKIASVNYPGLESSKDYELAKKYLPNGQSGVVSFEVKGDKETAIKFIDNLKLIALVVHVADARSSVLHPRSTSHRQLRDDQLAEQKISNTLIRLSVGIENIDDIIGDIQQALDNL